MKKTYLLFCLLVVFGFNVKTSAQTAPDPSTLMHQWTFDDGTANDIVVPNVTPVNGTLMDGATITNNALNTTKGGWVDLDGPTLAINMYSSITTEVWFTAAGGNGDYTMLTVYGNTGTGGGGENYLCTNPTHGSQGSRTAITTDNPDNWSGDESGANGPKCDDGVLHHLVSVVDGVNMTISLYIDGVLQQTNPLLFNNMIGSLGTDHFYFAKSDWAADPTWKGLMQKVSIYNAALTPDQVLYLFNKGAEDKQVITTGNSTMVFDSNYDAATTTVTGENLSFPITITNPAGITAQIQGVKVTSVPANSLNANVTFVYDGVTPVDGVITLTSGTSTNTIQVKAVSDAACFVPLYTDVTNLIPDPGMNTLTPFSGWGTKTIETLITDPADVFCGASTIKVGDGINPGSGSLDFHPGVLNDGKGGLLQPNTTYRIKVMAKTTGVFRVGIERTDLNHSANNVILHEFDTAGQWQSVDFDFATGDAIDVDPVIYINDWNLTGTSAFVDNWEIYPVQGPVITSTAKPYAFDDQYRTDSFYVTAANLVGDIAITTPAGITATPATLPAGSLSAVVNLTYDGTTPVNGNVTLTSGIATTSVLVETASNSGCFTPLYSDRPNLISDIYLNNQNKFNGWAHNGGSWGLISILDNPDSVYCGSHSAKLYKSADIEVPLTGMLIPNTSYISKAMVRTIGGYFHMGINGQDINVTGDLVDSVNTNGAWQEMTFEFNTGEGTATTPVIFFNNDKNSGTTAFLDNWELYKKDTLSAVINVKDQFANLYVQNGKIVAEFDLDHASVVQLTVFTVQGSMVSDEKITGIAGRNKKVVNAVFPTGVYMVKLTKEGQTSFRKLIL